VKILLSENTPYLLSEYHLSKLSLTECRLVYDTHLCDKSYFKLLLNVFSLSNFFLLTYM